jgi:zinc protease
VRETYRANALRENVSFGFAGDIDVATARTIAAGWLERLPSAPTLPSFADLRDPEGPRGRSLVIVDKPERTQTQILVGALGTSAHDEDHVPLMVGTAVFGGTFTSRLMREVRSKRGWSYGASARLNVERARHAFTMWTFPAATDAGKCLALELGLLEKLVTGGVSAKEVAFVKRYLVRSHAFEIDTPQKRMHQALDTHLLGLPADYHTGYVPKVLATSQEAVNAALARRIHTKDLGIVVVGTAKEIRDDLEKAIPDLARVSVVPFDAD